MWLEKCAGGHWIWAQLLLRPDSGHPGGMELGTEGASPARSPRGPLGAFVGPPFSSTGMQSPRGQGLRGAHSPLSPRMPSPGPATDGGSGKEQNGESE